MTPASEILNSRSNGNMDSTQVLKPVQSFDPYHAVQVVSCTLMLSPGALIPNNRCKNADVWRTDPSVSLDLSVGFRNEICGRICAYVFGNFEYRRFALGARGRSIRPQSAPDNTDRSDKRQGKIDSDESANSATDHQIDFATARNIETREFTIY